MSDRPAWSPPLLRLDDLVRRAAGRWPSRAALVDARTGAVTTFAALDAAVDRAAAATAASVPAGSVVAVATVPGAPFAAVHHGVVRAGGTVVTLNPLLPPPALVGVLRAAGARLAVVPDELADPLREAQGPSPAATVVTFSQFADRAAAAPAPVPPTGDLTRDLTATAVVHVTSGTTGPPKTVRLSHAALVANAAQTAAAQGLDATSVTLNQLPVFHVMHLGSALWAGATQVMAPGPDVRAAVAAADRYRATHWFGIPFRLTQLADDPDLADVRPATVRAVLCGGSALPARTARRLSARWGVPVVQGYGLAEASPLVTLDPVADPRPGSVGLPLPGTQVRVVDLRTRTPLGPGGRGEVEVHGPQLMTGYTDPSLPQPFTADGWLVTGDVGHLDVDGRLHLLDRVADVFVRAGTVVAPGEVEAVLRREDGIADAVVFGALPDAEGARACALVVAAHGSEPDDGLRARVDRDLPPTHRLASLRWVDRLPRTAGGKLRRGALTP
ncbi:fatty acid--CoA ligase family protein [Kineococcus sp. NPDC059986]|uniref:class I adenylate-forming enzyme family protein n=1 Tax=Kineococcus sp. NPDC059986 TaxID=3155538 RepID=UPI00344DD25E